MMEYFHQRIGLYRMMRNLQNIGRFHIHKEVPTNSHRNDHHYAKLPLSDRLKILERSTFSTDGPRLRDSTLILIDDIMITGSSERVLHKILLDCRPKKIIFLYVANMDAEIATSNPGIESILNQFWVKNLDQMVEIMSQSEGYRFNLRNCKFILEHPTEDVQQAASKLRDCVLEDLFQVCLANSYYLEPKYRVNIEALQDEMLKRGCLTHLCPAGPLQVSEAALTPSTPPS
jgi:hypothetical protein